MNHMIVLCGEIIILISRSKESNSSNSRHNKDVTTNAIKAVAAKSTSTITARPAQVNGYH